MCSEIYCFFKVFWNGLPELVVSAGSVNTLKSRLDKFLSDQEVLYDYNVARVFRIWGDLEIAHGHFQDFGQSRDGLRAFSGF